MHARQLEELTLNAWPAAQSLIYDGWILCFAGGYTRRANSIHLLYPSSLPLKEKISICEATYAACGRETVFKITSLPQDADLDRELDEHGYRLAGLTSVQTADLSNLTDPSDPSSAQAPHRGRVAFSDNATLASRAARSTPSDVDNAVAVATTLDDTWFADFNRLTEVPVHLQRSERRLLESIVAPHAFGSIALDDQAVAVGLAVVERGHVGLYDIVVERHHRNRGLARRLCGNLLNWGRQQGADTAYLAVVADNSPALALYASFGFQAQYRYWYRHQPTTLP